MCWVLLLAVGVCFFLSRRADERAREAAQERLRLMDLAEQLGLVVEDGALVGCWDGVPVRVEQRLDPRMLRSGAAFTSVHLSLERCDIAVARGPQGFASAWTGTALEQVGHWRGRDRILTGDDNFDSTFVVDGEEALATAVLTGAGRRALAHFCTLGGSVANGRLTVVYGGSVLELGASLRGKLDGAVRAARLLVVGESPVPRVLADNVRRDPLLAVRIRNLEVLVRHAPQSVEAREALQFALGCGEPHLVLAAARLCQSPEALLAVLTLAKSGPLGSRTAALSHLLDHYPLDSMREVLDGALRDHGSEQQALVVTQLGLLVARRDPDALALATLSVAAEDALCRLVFGGETRLAIASARVLGVGGSPRVLAYLLGASRGLRGNGALKDAAYFAALRIRERRTGEAGEVSVADDSAMAGALSDLPGPGVGDLCQVGASEVGTSRLEAARCMSPSRPVSS